MSQIKSINTTFEEVVRNFLFSQGFRYRKNDYRFPGRPDIVLPKYKCIIFVNGCFWHGHKNCKYFKLPETNAEFWKKKITDNMNRDKKNKTRLQEGGWQVITIWQCEVNNKKKCEKRLNFLIKQIKNNRP